MFLGLFVIFLVMYYFYHVTFLNFRHAQARQKTSPKNM